MMTDEVKPLTDMTTPKFGMKRKVNDSSLKISNPIKKAKFVDATNVGLSEFISSDFAPIFGHLKTRLEDFLVTEITEELNPVHLKSLSSVDLPTEDVKTPTSLPDEVKTQLESVLSKEITVADFPASLSKEERTMFHRGVAGYDSRLSTATVTESGSTLIRVKLKNEKDRRDYMFLKEARFLHFTLLKWNISTSDAILKLSQLLKLKPKNFSYAGLKDKRGITSQRISCKCMLAKRLAGMNKPFLEKNSDTSQELQYELNFLMGDFTYQKNDLKLGQMGGNSFSIILRDCEATTEENLAAIRSSLLSNGFLNYFGLQRFGNCGNTHAVGRWILKRDYQSAVTTILTSSPAQKPDVRAAIEEYRESVDAERALAKIRYRNSIEGMVLSALARDAQDYKQALKTLHYKQQILYTHALQSCIWNKVVSRRIAKFGHQILAGDLVYTDDTQKTVRELTEEEVESRDISEIVLPLPGYDITLPGNQCSTMYTELLAEEGMMMEDFSGSTGKEFNTSGVYRNMVVKPLEFDCQVLRYSNEMEKLLETDLDRVTGRSFKPTNEGQRTALHLTFSLPKSCYATMLLREISRGRIE